ncbi:hypothetical protein ACLOJK_036719, partial [Asimina triloba]
EGGDFGRQRRRCNHHSMLLPSMTACGLNRSGVSSSSPTARQWWVCWRRKRRCCYRRDSEDGVDGGWELPDQEGLIVAPFVAVVLMEKEVAHKTYFDEAHLAIHQILTLLPYWNGCVSSMETWLPKSKAGMGAGAIRSRLLCSPLILGKMQRSLKMMEDVATRDGLRSRRIRTRAVVDDLLDNFSCLHGASLVVVLAGSWVKMMAHCLDDEDAVSVGGVQRIWRRWVSSFF